LDKFREESFLVSTISLKELWVYMRIYNNQLIKVFTKEDLINSEVIGKLKGEEPVGFTFRDKKNNIVFYEIDKITATELQLMIRKSTTATIAIKLKSEEVIEYFYSISKIQLLEHNRTICDDKELYAWMNSSIDSGIVNSSVWDDAKPKVVEKLQKEGFTVIKKNKG